MKSPIKPYLILLALATLLPGTGCSDGTTPRVNDGLVGWVTDSTGAPVAGAAIGLEYEVQVPDPYAKPSTALKFQLPEATRVTLVVLDGMDQLVRTLMDGQLPAGSHTVIWNALDDVGNPAPNGLYVAVVETDQQEIARISMLLNSLDQETLFDRANVVTDDRGYFRIPRELVPTGAVIPYIDEGGLSNEAFVSSTVKVVVARRIDDQVDYHRETVTLVDGWKHQELNITLP